MLDRVAVGAQQSEVGDVVVAAVPVSVMKLQDPWHLAPSAPAADRAPAQQLGLGFAMVGPESILAAGLAALVVGVATRAAGRAVELVRRLVGGLLLPSSAVGARDDLGGGGLRLRAFPRAMLPIGVAADAADRLAARLALHDAAREMNTPWHRSPPCH